MFVCSSRIIESNRFIREEWPSIFLNEEAYPEAVATEMDCESK